MKENAPIVEMLLRYQEQCKASFHMPGHKMGKLFSKTLEKHFLRLDVTELSKTDDLYFPKEGIKEAQNLAAQCFGSDETFFLVNGSTVGILASILSVAKPGEKVIIGRDCHQSVVHAMMLSGAVPCFVQPHWEKEWGLFGAVTPQDIQTALLKNPNASAVFITGPNYYGICADINAIAEIVHAHNKILIVDEAHGSHFAFSKLLPPSALASHADIVIQSAHKTLPSLTQTAYLHILGNRVNSKSVKEHLRMLQTSSPSFLFLASLDMARQIMSKEGENLMQRLWERMETLRETIGRSKYLKLLGQDKLEKGFKDFTRLVVEVSRLGITGYEAEAFLRQQYGVYAEMADVYHVIFIATVADGERELKTLETALLALETNKHEKEMIKAQSFFNIPPQCMEPREAYLAQGRMVSLNDATGEVARQMLVPYPPGVPIVCPGEILTEEVVEGVKTLLHSGTTINGVSEGNFIEVVEGFSAKRKNKKVPK